MMNIDFILGNKNKILLNFENWSLLLLDGNEDKEERLTPFKIDDTVELVKIINETLGDKYEILNICSINNLERNLIKYIIYILNNENNEVKKIAVRSLTIFDVV